MQGSKDLHPRRLTLSGVRRRAGLRGTLGEVRVPDERRSVP
jgi:hypothetical protein